MNLQLIKKEMFGEVECDFYKDEDSDAFMTSAQLGRALGYSLPRESISKIVQRNEYLKHQEFSSEVDMTYEEGTRNTRVFTEDGIYEITLLAKTPKAQEFRAWVRVILRSLRGSILILNARPSYVIKDPVVRSQRWIEEQNEHKLEIAVLEESKGFNSLQVSKCIAILKSKLSNSEKKPTLSKLPDFLLAKATVFKYFNVTKWESIPSYKFDDVIEFMKNYQY